MIATIDTDNSFSLRKKIRPRGNHRNPIKNAFYTFYMAIFDLVVIQKKSPENVNDIFNSLINIEKSLTSSSHYANPSDRKNNIKIIKGLIQDYFVDKTPPVFNSGPGLSLQLENALRRSKTETPSNEIKQGFINLDPVRNKRKWNRKLESQIINTICAISNTGCDGNIFIGVCDKPKDAETVEKIDGISSININGRYIVGIDREAAFLNISLDDYVLKITKFIDGSALTDKLKKLILSKIDIINYRGLSVIRIVIPKQNEPSFIGAKCYVRQGTETKEIIGPEIFAISDNFQ